MSENLQPSLEDLIYQLDSSESSADSQPLDPTYTNPNNSNPFNDGISGDDDAAAQSATETSEEDSTDVDQDVLETFTKTTEEEDDDQTTAEEGEQSDDASTEADDSDASKADDNDTSADHDYESYFNLLKSQGLLVLDDEYEFDNTAEGLQKAFQDAQKNIYNDVYTSLRDSFPEDFLPILEYVSKGGDNVKDVLALYSAQQDYTSLSIEDEANQVKLLKAYLKETSSFSDAKIDREIEKAKLGDFLLEEATEAQLELQKIYDEKKEVLANEKAKQLAAEQAKQDEMRQAMAEVIQESKAIVPQRKNKVKAFMFNVSEINGHKDTGFNRTLQQVAATPEHLIQLADMLLDYDPKKGFNVDRLREKSKAAAIRTFKEQLDAVTGVKTKVSGKGSKRGRTNFN